MKNAGIFTSKTQTFSLKTQCAAGLKLHTKECTNKKPDKLDKTILKK